MDIIADMLTIIRNGLAVEKKSVLIPFSNLKEEVLKLLKKEGYLKSVKKTEKDNREYLKVGLKYKEEQPAINEMVRVSKPGRRVYVKADQLKPYLPRAGKGKELGLVIVSTSKGLKNSKQARKENLGGEVLFKIN